MAHDPLQLTLYSSDAAQPQLIEIEDGELVYYPQLFSVAQSDRWLTVLQATVQWRQDAIRMFGKLLPLPRLTAWYGDRGTTYSYSGITMQPSLWTAELQEIKSGVEAIAHQPFNSVLLNYYRQGRDSMSWHSDDEPELGQNPVIASVSFGGTRRFMLRHKFRRELSTVKLDLAHGSCLLMKGATQHFWQHQIPKTTKPVSPRINLTFRVIRNSGI